MLMIVLLDRVTALLLTTTRDSTVALITPCWPATVRQLPRPIETFSMVARLPIPLPIFLIIRDPVGVTS